MYYELLLQSAECRQSVAECDLLKTSVLFVFKLNTL